MPTVRTGSSRLCNSLTQLKLPALSISAPATPVCRVPIKNDIMPIRPQSHQKRSDHGRAWEPPFFGPETGPEARLTDAGTTLVHCNDPAVVRISYCTPQSEPSVTSDCLGLWLGLSIHHAVDDVEFGDSMSDLAGLAVHRQV